MVIGRLLGQGTPQLLKHSGPALLGSGRCSLLLPRRLLLGVEEKGRTVGCCGPSGTRVEPSGGGERVIHATLHWPNGKQAVTIRQKQRGRLSSLFTGKHLCGKGIAHLRRKSCLRRSEPRGLQREGGQSCQWLSDSHQGDSRALRPQGAISLAVSALDSEWQL